ncbi:hypothetical protein PFZ59_02850 [Streptococcus suis]|uniref:hypothetical protein n=1 Tax=Streptococcus suis TaxID=1307 RepID=UPI00240E4DDA|nr:hypothetical protein [Streptococcus suis]WFA76415.1 hypothetical protein PFZ59_02850 [Streptococcus suis]
MKTVAKMIKEFGEDKMATKKAFIENRTQLEKKFASGYLGQEGLVEIIRLNLDELEARSERKAAEVLQVLTQVVERERYKIRSLEKQVTADDLAELTLIDTMKVTEQEFKYYFRKFEQKPLALKKMAEIHSKHYLAIFPCPRSKKAIFEEWAEEAHKAIEYINHTLKYSRAFEHDLLVDRLMLTNFDNFLTELREEYEKTEAAIDKESQTENDKIKGGG